MFSARCRARERDRERAMASTPAAERVWVLVNTCHAYFPATAPALLESLTGAGGVPFGRAIVVVGETAPGAPAPACRGVAESGAAVHCVPWANLDNNALIWASGAARADGAPGAEDAAAALPDDGWLFYLHDTCTVTEGFWAKVVARVQALEALAPRPLAAKMHRPYSMCIGLYAVAGLRRAAVRDDLARRVNLDRSPAARMRIKRDLGTLEDHVFRRLEAEGPGALWVYPNAREVLARGETPYGTATPRICEYYADPGVVKVKANFGEGLDLHVSL